MTVGEIEQKYGAMASLPYKEQVSQLIAKDKDEAIGVMREWLKQ